MTDTILAPGQAGAAPIRDAATIIVVDRDGPNGPSVLMGQRGKAAAFMPSKYVFPGGAIDPEDRSAALAGNLSDMSAQRMLLEPREESEATPASVAAAALRELAEETGLMSGAPGPAPANWERYAASGLSPDPSGLIYFFRAITPPRLTRRFDARFLLLDAARIHGDRKDFSAATDELSHLHWVPVEEARKLDLPFITEVVLAELLALLKASQGRPLVEPDSVPFFDNRGSIPRFIRIS